MSAEVEAVGFLVGLGILAAGVILPALPAASRRVKAIQRTRESRQREAVAILSMPSVGPSRTDRTGADVAANWHSAERQVWAVKRPAGDTQEWEIQERVVDEPTQAAEVVDEDRVEPDDVALSRALVPASWMVVALQDEPTPLADAIGPVPGFDELESFTKGWNRAELLERIRQAELAMAMQADPEPDEELAA